MRTIHWPARSRGGFFGLLAGVLTTGILVMGLGHLSPGQQVLGVQPLGFQGSKVSPTDDGSKLWFPVDRMTSRFYRGLSRGAFSPSFSHDNLASHRPEPHVEAHASRLSLDQNASRVAHPGSVEITALYSVPLGEDSGAAR